MLLRPNVTRPNVIRRKCTRRNVTEPRKGDFIKCRTGILERNEKGSWVLKGR